MMRMQMMHSVRGPPRQRVCLTHFWCSSCSSAFHWLGAEVMDRVADLVASTLGAGGKPHPMAAGPPLVWSYLGVANGGKYCKARAKAAAVYRQKLVNAVEQKAARRMFLFKAAAVDTDEDTKNKAIRDRVLELAPPTVASRVKRLDDKLVRADQLGVVGVGMLIHTKRDELLEDYRRAEATERETMDKLAKRVKTIARRLSPLGAAPCDVQKETLAQLTFFATDMHLEDLEAAEEACVDFVKAPADEDEDMGKAADDAFDAALDEALDAAYAGALAAAFARPPNFEEEEDFAAAMA